MSAGNELTKKERLSSKSSLSLLVSSGKYGREGIMSFRYILGNGLGYNRIVVSVPKRNFRRAVKRNLLKRRIREAYRTNKTILPLGTEGGADILLVYNSKEVLQFSQIVPLVTNILKTIATHV